eukprot:3838042-Prymnesium_polylepis.3
METVCVDRLQQILVGQSLNQTDVRSDIERQRVATPAVVHVAGRIVMREPFEAFRKRLARTCLGIVACDNMKDIEPGVERDVNFLGV